MEKKSESLKDQIFLAKLESFIAHNIHDNFLSVLNYLKKRSINLGFPHLAEMSNVKDIVNH